MKENTQERDYKGQRKRSCKQAGPKGEGEQTSEFNTKDEGVNTIREVKGERERVYLHAQDERLQTEEE